MEFLNANNQYVVLQDIVKALCTYEVLTEDIKDKSTNLSSVTHGVVQRHAYIP